MRWFDMAQHPTDLPLSFRRLSFEDLQEIALWFQDPVLARRIQPPDQTWINYILSDNGTSRSWVAVIDGEGLAAEIQVDQQEAGGAGYINFYIKPSLRGRGLGVDILRLFLKGPGAEFPRIDASIEPDNVASLQCFHHAGFHRSPVQDEEGMVRLHRMGAN